MRGTPLDQSEFRPMVEVFFSYSSAQQTQIKETSPSREVESARHHKNVEEKEVSFFRLPAFIHMQRLHDSRDVSKRPSV